MDLLPGAWQLWVMAGVALALLEIAASGFVLLWLGLGALAAAVPAALGLPAWAQLATFALFAMGLFAASRTVFKKLLMRDATRVKTNADAMIGAEALVVDAIPAEGTGTVRINGELWSARSLTGPIAEGEVSRVERRDGLKLYVRKPGVPLAGASKESVA